MITKDITFGREAHQKIKAGVDKLANVVKSTLGPGGTNVILQRGDTQAITKDGVSVAREIFLADTIENIGAQIVKEAAERTVNEAGDGTTTATVLAQAIFNKGLEHINQTGSDGAALTQKLIDVKRGIDIAVAAVVKELKAMSKPVAGEDILRIAMISANGDQEIGNLVGEAMTEVGLEGIVSVEESKTPVTFRKKVDGMQWNRGYLNHHFVTNPEKMECYLEDPVVLVYDGTINSMREVMGNDPQGTANIISRYRQGPGNTDLHGLPLFIVCNDAGAEFIATMAYNAQKGALRSCIVQAPEFQDIRKAILYDIAAMTGATVISKDSGFKWSDVKPEHLGRCDAVRVTGWTTTIIGGRGGLKATNRANEIRTQITENPNDIAVSVLRSRLARLVNGLNVIYVGGGSQIEIDEKKDRIDDALNATRAAMEEGVLPGGGLALLKIKNNGITYEGKSADQAIGADIVEQSMEVPFRTIMENAGINPEVVLPEIEAATENDYGYNAQTMQHENLLVTGVIDPTKVVRLALENAASVAGMLLTTRAIVSHEQFKPKS